MKAMIEEASQVWPTAKIAFIRPRFLEIPTDDLEYNDEFIARLESAAWK